MSMDQLASESAPQTYPCWIQEYLNYTEGVAGPEIFRRWAAIGVVAAAMERKTFIAASGGHIYPNMYILLISAPGGGKDQAIIPARELLSSSGLCFLAPLSMTNKGLLDEMVSPDCGKTVNDPALGAVAIHHAMTIIIPELGVLLPAHDLHFLSILNEIYNCPKFVDERLRKQDERLVIEYPCLNIIGGTQPKFLGELFPKAAFGMGFTSRLIMIYSDYLPKSPILSRTQRNKSLRNYLVENLRRIARLTGKFSFTPEAVKAIEDWHMNKSSADAPVHSKLIYYNTRRILHVLKVSAVLSAARSDSLEISHEIFFEALDIMKAAEQAMPNIFHEIASGTEGDEMETAFNYVVAYFLRHKKPMPHSMLVEFLSARVPVHQVEQIIKIMLQARMLKGDYIGLKVPENIAYIPARMEPNLMGELYRK